MQEPTSPSVALNPQSEARPIIIPAGEIFEREMEVHPNKSPVAIVQEVLARNRITARYDLLAITGPIYRLQYQYRATVDELHTALGMGRSKRFARRDAAANLIALVTGRKTFAEVNDRHVIFGEPVEPVDPANPNEPEVRGRQQPGQANGIVQYLDQICARLGLPSADYHVRPLQSTQMRTFLAKCQVAHMWVCASGRSRKIAKRFAAHKMRQLLLMRPMRHYYY